MPLTNSLRPVVDQQVFEWMRFVPTRPTANSSLCSSWDKSGRFLYYNVSSAFWRYDTYADTWQELATMVSAPSLGQLKFHSGFGWRGIPIAATSTTLTVGGFGNCRLIKGLKIRIVSGTGAGQERTITSVSDPVVAYNNGVLSSVANGTLADANTMNIIPNEWIGYNVRIVGNNGQGQVRQVLRNTSTSFQSTIDGTYNVFPYTAYLFNSTAPYAALSATAGSQSIFQAESCVLTVDSPWTVTPTINSVYQIMSGGVFQIAGATSTPYSIFQMYDPVIDNWMARSSLGLHLNSNFVPAEVGFEVITEASGVLASGTATSGTSTTLANSGASMTVDRWANHQLRITSGTGIGQKRRIVGHNATTFFVNSKWDVTPDSTSQYQVWPDTDMMWCLPAASTPTAALYGYHVEADQWCSGHLSDHGTARTICATVNAAAGYGSPYQALTISSITRVTTGILSATISTAGSGYKVGALVACSTGGTGGQFWVRAVDANGGVTAVDLAACGSGYSAGSSNTTAVQGTGLVLSLTVGITASLNGLNNLVRGPVNGTAQQSITIAGCSTDTSFNNTFSIIGYDGTNAYIAAPSSTASPTAAASQSTTQLVDASKNWTTNEHVGKYLVTYYYLTNAMTTPNNLLIARISANTATTLTVSSITAPTNGITRYTIQEPRGFGAMMTYRNPAQSGQGWATSGTATTLVDSSKNWTINQWQNCKVRVMCGTGVGNESTITGNSATTLTVASWGVATPDSTSKYEILDSFGLVTTAGTAVTTITDSAKNWVVNSLVGKRVKVIGGTGVGVESTITSNTATVLTTGTSQTTSIDSRYVIYDNPGRGTGANALIHLYGLSDSDKKARWLLSPRGNTTPFWDIYDIPTNTWLLNPLFSPQAATLTSGSMFTYDGTDTVFFNKDETQRLYAIDMSTMEVKGAGITPYNHGSQTTGNRMEVVKTSDGLKYLYIMRHSGSEMWRTLYFW